MKPFAIFYTEGELETIMENMIKERTLRSRVEELESYKNIGLRTFQEVDVTSTLVKDLFGSTAQMHGRNRGPDHANFQRRVFEYEVVRERRQKQTTRPQTQRSRKGSSRSCKSIAKQDENEERAPL